MFKVLNGKSIGKSPQLENEIQLNDNNSLVID